MKRTALLFILVTTLISCNTSSDSKDNSGRDKPNVILIMTDDQGIGDVGFNGNPYIKTPNLDRLAEQSTRFTSFYVSPVCAPTRSSLMTGKFYERTGVYDTYNGGAVMATEEVTIAELLKENDYKTAIFGKWHLGDNYPFRPMDQGFDMSLVHGGGGMGQPGDVANYFAFDSAYFNPVLMKNGKPVKTSGYCSDVFTDGAIGFIKENSKSPFFVYLAFNAPHTPLQLPERYFRMYENLVFDPDSFGENKQNLPALSERELDDARRVYGMVTNIDDNLGRLFKALEDNKISDNTLVVFLTDNGPQQNRYRMGLRGRKGTVYEGGIKVPCLIRYPRVFPANKKIDAATAHIDLLPTILDVCGIDLPGSIKIDGCSLLPLLNSDDSDFRDRFLFWEWNRGFPLPWQNFAVRKGDFKLVGNCGYDSPVEEFELFNLRTDPYELDNIVNDKNETALMLKSEMENWYGEVIGGEHYRNIPRIIIGTDKENPVVLNRNDAKGSTGIWTQEEIYGYWDVKIENQGIYDLKVNLIKPVEVSGKLYLRIYPHQYMKNNTDTGISELNMGNLPLTTGDYRLEVYYQENSGRTIFPFSVEVERTN